jgi:hypothetical protein
MEYYKNEIIKIIQNEKDYLNKYIDCDIYSNDFIDININNLIEEIENNCIIYNNKRIRIIQIMNKYFLISIFFIFFITMIHHS